MTKSTIARERMEEIRDCCWMDDLSLSMDELSDLARMALAAMDSEPVIIVGDDGGDALSYRRLIQSFAPGTKLYRHAQPAPVSYSDFEEFWSSYIHPLAQDDELKGFAWDIWCAAMLQAGNSQVIPDGWTCNDKANAALMMLDRIETVDPVDDDRIDGIKRIVRELAAAPHDTPALNSVQSVDTVADRWIPVSERIPDNTEPVLCIEKRADFGTYGQPFVCWHDGGGWVGKTNYRPIVTHWMPLPAGPQEVR
ncbi:DUF551 domain-containing protein [Klebsiella pneumoniae]